MAQKIDRLVNVNVLKMSIQTSAVNYLVLFIYIGGSLVFLCDKQD